ncbi:A/G-specific adenine glycosylase [Kingella potus]|uniref:Adenine DNA glycosylase n=1 Tax=Kingella potus TaxID=265175 RepID=A0A377QZP3_9NEIS|nr:A/G-specific adenine glycosylase [Kingella potus]STR00452.1 A/G-specific adenine glycosylase [Kingella potus]
MHTAAAAKTRRPSENGHNEFSDGLSDTFAARLIRWQQKHGRHNLPWHSRDPYRVWLSEIMLQQTQVAAVAGYYPRFLAAFPTVSALAAAPEDQVLALWQGLGYYSRARNLHKAAKQIMAQHGGIFPDTRAGLEALSGIGRSTAAAVAAFAFHRREAILDGNVKRVLCRVFARDGDPSDKKFGQSLWTLAESLLPPAPADMPAYTQGLMDLGATVCKRSKPLCAACPMAGICQARAQGRTAELPRRKAAQAVQTLPLYWLVLRRPDGALLLEKRPAQGIWGGLYCVPCFTALEDLYQAAARYGLSADSLEEQAAITHRLTHRLLLVTPFAAQCRRPHPPQACAEDGCGHFSDGLWVPPQELAGYGLPKPLAAYLAAASAV